MTCGQARALSAILTDMLLAAHLELVAAQLRAQRWRRLHVRCIKGHALPRLCRSPPARAAPCALRHPRPICVSCATITIDVHDCLWFQYHYCCARQKEWKAGKIFKLFISGVCAHMNMQCNDRCVLTRCMPCWCAKPMTTDRERWPGTAIRCMAN